MHSLVKTAPVYIFFLLFVSLGRADKGLPQSSSAAPKPVKLRVLVTDCTVKIPKHDPEIGRATTDAFNTAIDRFGKKQFERIDRQEVWAAAERLGLTVPEEKAPSGHWTDEDKFRLGQSLHADLLCKSEVGVCVNRKNAKTCDFVLNPDMFDISVPLVVSSVAGMEKLS